MTTRALAYFILMLALFGPGSGLTRDNEPVPAGATPSFRSELVVAGNENHSIAGLILHTPERREYRHGIALFPGHPGILRLRMEDAAIVHELKGNFLIRSARHWLDEQTLVVAVDAPSDEWSGFSQAFRATPRYGADIASLLKAVEQRFKVAEWTLVGTSEGSVSAFHAARMNPEVARRLILTASVFSASRNGPGLSNVRRDDLPMPVMLVHHEDDPCRYTRHADAVTFAMTGATPLMTVKGGGPARGNPCMAFTAHGFVGVEKETVEAMRRWVQTGSAPQEIRPR